MKQTAVEWLVEQLENVDYNPLEKGGYDTAKKRIIEQAKAMEKEQMKVMFDCGRQYQLTGEGTFTQVHNEIYNNEVHTTKDTEG